MKVITHSRNTKSKINPQEKNAFNALAFLNSAGLGRSIMKYRRSQRIYTQGDLRTDVLYVQQGGVKLSVVNPFGKEAVVAVLGPGTFFGEACLVRQFVRRETATALTSTTVLAIQQNEMIRVLHTERAFADRFITYLLARNGRIEEDLIDQLFNSIEKRLARALLVLTRYGMQEVPQKMLPKISQEMLAQKIGTTRTRVNYFMTKFRKLGFIGYDGGLHINPALLRVLLQE
jgi:CRP/FNR family cyclic AMP-dependent transcriptional regulator